ncbi:MAG: hypothetical protein DI533_13905 [Cereibacter sphaeroides]|uniref:OmpA-like domain-containing protein n=1 Tax=Cereibacter sphaeroides TaxID=1063 RepID=A0A2W5S132_CERSP|nr:MAG: hypothetical protein DI533_13905 [Cereibacter sphaeroides]
MNLHPRLVLPAAFVLAAGLSVLTSLWAAHAIESRTGAAVKSLMTREGLSWVDVGTDGLQVRLGGTAPNEALRFRAMNLTASLVDSSRIRDRMEVTPVRAIEPPRFSVELLRNDDGISLIGLVPANPEDAALPQEVADIASGVKVTDMLEKADFPAPEGWDKAVSFGLDALKMLPRSKISIAADRVAVTAISSSPDEKRRFETALARARPEGLAVEIDISAPRPVLTPFTLRFLKDDRGARFDACSADTDAARERILQAAVAAGLTGKLDCTVGLGVPTPRWAEAVALGITAVNDLGTGSVTFSDADVSLLATVETPQATFDRVVGDLQAALPDVFSLDATLPEKPKAAPAEGPPEFTATLSADGQVQLRGRLTDATLRDAVANFAKAQFGAASVYTATRLDPTLPDGWPVRVLAGLQAMSNLHEGKLLVREDTVEISGVTVSTDAQAAITRTLSDRLGQGKAFKVDVRYDESLDPQAALPTPNECVASLNAVLTKQKIAFAPGSAEIEDEARGTMDALADALRRCPDIPMEIGGHTDSQGREETNLALSQARAEAVLLGLQGRRVLVGAITAKGYGESRPIAENGSETGREANRRIEFTLIATVQEPVGPMPADTPAADQAASAEGSGDGDPAAADAQDSPEGSGDGDPAVIEGNDTNAGSGDEDMPPDAVVEENGDEPFVSVAPKEKTQRPQRRPEEN